MILSREANRYYSHEYSIDSSYKKWKRGGYGIIYYNSIENSIIKKIPRYEEHTSCSDKFYPSLATNKDCIYYIYYPAIQEACFSKLLSNFQGFVGLTSVYLSAHFIYFHQKYLGNTLHHHIPMIDKEERPHVIAEILRLCIIMEVNGLQHTDLKTNNILYNPTTNGITIIDYNCMSTLYVENDQLKWVDSIGTWMYVAPEIAFNNKINDNSIVWTIGMLIASMLQQYPISKEFYPTYVLKNTISERKEWIITLKNICIKETEPYFSKCFETIATNYQQILSKIFYNDPQQRPSLLELYNLWTSTFNLPVTKDFEQYYHEIVVTPFLGWGENDRSYIIHHIYKFCIRWNQIHKFCTMIHIIDNFSKHIIESVYEVVIFSAWTIVNSLMNEHVQDHINIYKEIEEVYKVRSQDISEMVWIICDYLKWDIYEKPLDVWFIQNKKIIDYDKIVEIFIQQKTSYSMKSLFEVA